MAKRIAIIRRPDSRGDHFGHALADAYEKSAEAAGHEVKLIDVGKMDFPLFTQQKRLRDRSTAGDDPTRAAHVVGPIKW
jgi:putative NADPH-quinone reductase